MSNVEKTPQQRKIEWDEKYGGMTRREYNATVSDMLSGKFSAYHARIVEEAEREKAEEKSLTYPQIVKAIPEALKRVEQYKDMPKALQEKKKSSLNKQFTTEVKYEREFESNRELWVSDKLLKWMETDPEYLQAKQEFTLATNDYSKYVYLKEKWEKDHADIIKAEKDRSARAELMQADPETLRALGITPEVVVAPVEKTADDGKSSLREALRAIHPSASDVDIENMVKQV